MLLLLHHQLQFQQLKIQITEMSLKFQQLKIQMSEFHFIQNRIEAVFLGYILS